MEWLKQLLAPFKDDHQPTYLSEDYWVFSTAFDEEVTSDRLMHNARKRGGATVANAAYKAMQEALAAERTAVQIATSRLAEEIAQEQDTSDLPAITCLVDHSGSLRHGDHVQLAVAMAEAIALIAFKLRVPFEVLGFTTQNWKGEPVREIWRGRGKPPNPGRLCALRHIVYSDFSQVSLPSMGAVFLPKLLKENVDGEAILWALDRAKGSGRDRHLLIVVSDGAPVDDSTLHSNNDDFLVAHLREVVASVSENPRQTLLALGIDHPVSRYYPNSEIVRFFGDIERKALPLIREMLMAERRG